MLIINKNILFIDIQTRKVMLFFSFHMKTCQNILKIRINYQNIYKLIKTLYMKFINLFYKVKFKPN